MWDPSIGPLKVGYLILGLKVGDPSIGPIKGWLFDSRSKGVLCVCV